MLTGTQVTIQNACALMSDHGCNIWALVYGLCNYLDDNGRTLLLQWLPSDPGNFPSAATVVLGICSDQIISKQSRMVTPIDIPISGI